MSQGKQRFCNGCFTLIAPFDPDAFRVGPHWFHNGRCQQKMLDRTYEVYLRRLWLEVRKHVRAA